jgi:hypothetical protein
MKAIVALAALLALCIAGTQTAQAKRISAEQYATSESPDAVANWPAKALQLKVIYSNFNDDRKNIYDPVGYLISSPESDFHQRFSVAAPFTPLEDAAIRQVQMPFFSMWAPQSVEVSIRKDEEGMPGAVMKRFSVPSPLWDGSGRLLIQTVKLEEGIPVIAGKKYWIATRALGTNQSAWFRNSLDLRGDFLRKLNASKWEPTYDVLPAFAVLGD